MDETTTPTTASKSAYSGDRYTHKGTMPKDLAKRHKLINSGASEDVVLDSHHRRAKLKKSIQNVKTYRLFVHKVLERHLARSLVMSCGYFCNVNTPEFRQRDKTVPTPAEAAAQ